MTGQRLKAPVMALPTALTRPKIVALFGRHLVRKKYHISDMATSTHDSDLRSRLLARIATSPNEVWTPGDFADLGSRATG